MMMNSQIFRAYDIRGIVDQDLTVESVTAIGQAIGSTAIAAGENQVFVGRDGRLSGSKLIEALIDGMNQTGCDAIDLGTIPTPLLYFAAATSNQTASGVMVTGSHNPPEYNGLKTVIAGNTLSMDSIQQLYRRIVAQDFSTGDGRARSESVVSRYIETICADISLKQPLKVVIDCGNGIAGAVAPTLFRQLGCEVIELYCKVDGHFPNHHPNPSDYTTLTDLITTVKQQQADVGLAFDGDGDRLGVVTNQGTIVAADRQLILYAQDILARHPHAKIIYDVKSSWHCEKMIKAAGGQPIMTATGHSLVKAKLKATGALLAGEVSGHMFFKERWYGFDDALYTGARLLEILSASEYSAEDLFATIPTSASTPEINIAIAEEKKASFMQKLLTTFHPQDAKRITIDGLRLEFNDGWGLIRPSNTTPCLVTRFEATDVQALQRIQTIFRDQLLALDNTLQIPF